MWKSDSHLPDVAGGLAVCVGWMVACVGLILGFGIAGAIGIPPNQLAKAVVVVLLLGMAPALSFAAMPYEVTLRDDQECDFRALLRQRRVRVQQIRSISSDEADIYIRYDGGKVHMLTDSDFEELFICLVELNPGIKVTGWLRKVVDEAESPLGTRSQRTVPEAVWIHGLRRFRLRRRK